MAKDTGRRMVPSLKFSGKNVDTLLKDYLESVSYTDVASGSADTLDIRLQDIRGKWLNEYYPKKGNTVSGKLLFKDWGGKSLFKAVICGTFTLDDIRVSLSPMTMELSCVSSPAKESFQTRERNKTWEKVTLKEVATEICKRYGLDLLWQGKDAKISKLEQSETDSSFLMSLLESYEFAMKIYRDRLVVYNITDAEAGKPVATLTPADFSDVSFTDGIYGTYTGARVSYKPANGDKEISVYVGLKGEHAKGSRILKVNESCSSEGEARRKGAAQVNKSNRGATTMSGTLFPDPDICSGVCVKLSKDFGKLAGKYFIDKVTWEAGSGTSQKVEAHKVKKKVKA